MDQKLNSLCDLFIRNRDIIKSEFFWESSYIYPVCAAIFMEKGRTADPERMEECKKILKDNTGIFSNFRGIVKLAMISLLAVDSEPERKMTHSMEVYDALKDHFFASSYLPVASMLIADTVQPSEYESIAGRTRRIYDLMKADHPFLTCSEDSIFAAMMALSDRQEAELVEEAEQCYDILHGQFISCNAIQSLSHVLAMVNLPADVKCRRTMDLFYGLKKRGYTYGTGYELATLGVPALLVSDSSEQDKVLEEIIEVDDFLSGQKGYGLLGIGRKQRLMHSALIVTSAHMEQDAAQTIRQAAIGGTVSMMAAQQAAMYAAVAASSAAAASSASS